MSTFDVIACMMYGFKLHLHGGSRPSDVIWTVHSCRSRLVYILCSDLIGWFPFLSDCSTDKVSHSKVTLGAQTQFLEEICWS